MDYNAVIQKYQDKRDRRKAVFVQKFYIEKKEITQIIEEMRLNNKRQFYRLKQAVRIDISRWFTEQDMDYSWMWHYYMDKNERKKAAFVQFHYINELPKHKIMENMYLTEKEFYRMSRRVQSDIAKLKLNGQRKS